MPFELLALLIVALLIGHPLVQWYRDRQLARRLEQARDAREAAAIVEGAIAANEAEAATFRDLKRYW